MPNEINEYRNRQISKYTNKVSASSAYNLGIYLLAVLLCSLLAVLSSVSPQSALAQSASQSGIVNVKVVINGFAMTLSGYLAPYASITMTSNGSVFASTTADGQGNFTFSGVKVAKGFSTFCLDGIDYKRLGESEACFSIPPVTGVYNKNGIFLPPTLGVFRADVNVGNNALVFGYGMPGSLISIHLDGNTICQKTADKGGYYECSFGISKAGDHQVYADASLNNKASEPQLKRVLIKGIGLVKTPTITPSVGNNLNKILFGLPGILVALFLLLVLIILLIIWLKKHPPAWLPRVYLPNPESLEHSFANLFRERKLHHYWMKGVGY